MGAPRPLDPQDDLFVASARVEAGRIEEGAKEDDVNLSSDWRVSATNAISRILGWAPEDYARRFLGRGPVVAGRLAALIEDLLTSRAGNDYFKARGVSLDASAWVSNGTSRLVGLASNRGMLPPGWVAKYQHARNAARAGR